MSAITSLSRIGASDTKNTPSENSGQQRFGRGQGQAGLAHAARPVNVSSRTSARRKPAGDRAQISPAPDEAGQDGREIGRWCGSGCRKGDDRRSYLC